MTLDLTRKRFIQGSAAVGGGLALGGPLAALTARNAQGKRADSSTGFGPLTPTPEQDTGIVFLALPPGFTYRVISRQGDPSFVYDQSGNRTPAPTPGIFDGMAAYPLDFGRHGRREWEGDGDDDDRHRGHNRWTVLVRNHENREQSGEIPFAIPPDKRYDPNPATGNAGNTKLIVGPDRRVRETIQVFAGSSTNCMGGPTPWDSWITSEEVFKAGGPNGHGYNFEIPSQTLAPVKAEPIRRAGRFSHEAVAWVDGVLYETEDRSFASRSNPPAGSPSPLPQGYGGGGFYRYLPGRKISKAGDLAKSNGVLEMLGVKGQPLYNFDTAPVGVPLEVVWYRIDEPEPQSETPIGPPQTTGTRFQGQNKGAATFDRPEGAWVGNGKVYFSCTAGGTRNWGQLFEFDPAEQTITLIYEGQTGADLEGPDNVVFTPWGDVFLQEDAGDPQYVRGVTTGGAIYDFAHTILNGTEFCGGCFSPDGSTFFLNQQGERGLSDDEATINAEGALTYAIWGPFEKRGRGRGNGRGDD